MHVPFFFENGTDLVNLPLCRDSLRGQNDGWGKVIDAEKEEEQNFKM